MSNHNKRKLRSDNKKDVGGLNDRLSQHEKVKGPRKRLTPTQATAKKVLEAAARKEQDVAHNRNIEKLGKNTNKKAKKVATSRSANANANTNVSSSVIDVSKKFGPGWKMRVGNRPGDKYYYTPEHELKLRSKIAVKRFKLAMKEYDNDEHLAHASATTATAATTTVAAATAATTATTTTATGTAATATTAGAGTAGASTAGTGAGADGDGDRDSDSDDDDEEEEEEEEEE
eukprot:CAMPEP_0170995862 /NCGR_PEP_ID=MMETSP0736-20130129/11866_1 /TAXON_ID=186038 /ORGANISM="Fragilariopsis kerguelensis, Strain L26-C5" /LENGTH=230 /DNA_ID=CAMNT_0011422141 /DNA_START=96 /DNA_END=785 /DNA_ORIENTATION=+